MISSEPSLLADLPARLAALAPKAALILLIVTGGLIASSILRRVVRAAVQRSGLDALAESAGVSRLLYAIGAKQGFASALGTLAFFTGLLATLSVACDALGLTIVSQATGIILRYGPRLLGAGAMMMGTLWLASFVQGLVRHFAQSRDDVESPEGAARLAYAFVAVLGAMLSAEQAGLEVRFLTTLLQLALGLLGLALAITFALGFHGVFRGMAAGHYYRPLVRVGDKVRIGEDRGEVLRFSPTAIVLGTDEGERIVPCTRLLEHTVIIETQGSVRDERASTTDES